MNVHMLVGAFILLHVASVYGQQDAAVKIEKQPLNLSDSLEKALKKNHSLDSVGEASWDNQMQMPSYPADPNIARLRANEERLQKIIALQEQQIADLKAKISELEKKNAGNSSK
jgi:hypothetical protein